MLFVNKDRGGEESRCPAREAASTTLAGVGTALAQHDIIVYHPPFISYLLQNYSNNAINKRTYL